MFKEILKTFGKTIAVVIGIFCAFIPLAILSTLAGPSSCGSEQTIFTCLPNLEGERKSHFTAPAILQINIHGVIGETIDYTSVVNQLIDSRLGLLKGGKVKGILLHLNTPGGAINDTDIIYRHLLQYKKRYNVPVYAFVEGMCASGGTYISCAADKIYASPVSIIGSVGVRMGPFFNVVDTLETIGIKTKTITDGKNKDMMNPFRNWKEGESQYLDSLSNYFYNRFVTVVSSARPKLTKNLLVNTYGAGVFDPVEAKQIGFIDIADSSYEEALSALMKESGIDPKDKYQIVELIPKKHWFRQFMAKSPLLSGILKHDWNMKTKENPFSYQYQP
jgi:protease IV